MKKAKNTIVSYVLGQGASNAHNISIHLQDRLYLSGRYFSPSPNMKYDKKVFNSACLLVAPYQLF